jgi:hypothetical protein
LQQWCSLRSADYSEETFLAIYRTAGNPDLHYANWKSEEQRAAVELAGYDWCCTGSRYGCPQDTGIRSNQFPDTTFVRSSFPTARSSFLKNATARDKEKLARRSQDANSNLLNDIGRKGQNRLMFWR